MAQYDVMTQYDVMAHYNVSLEAHEHEACIVSTK